MTIGQFSRLTTANQLLYNGINKKHVPKGADTERIQGVVIPGKLPKSDQREVLARTAQFALVGAELWVCS